MTVMINESDTVSQELLKVLLESIRKENQVSFFLLYCLLIDVLPSRSHSWLFLRMLHRCLLNWVPKLLKNVQRSLNRLSWKQ